MPFDDFLTEVEELGRGPMVVVEVEGNGSSGRPLMLIPEVVDTRLQSALLLLLLDAAAVGVVADSILPFMDVLTTLLLLSRLYF